MLRTMIVVWAALFLSAVGCSSKETHIASGVRTTEEDRATYASQVREELRDWDDKAAKFSDEVARDLRANIEDARTELRYMETASATDWHRHHANLENTMGRMRARYGSVAE